jgi:replicative DNA helicase
MKAKQDDYVPILKTKKDVAEEAKAKINEERSGKQLGLKTRFSKLNTALGKFFRFRQVTSINGLSGHGKSAILNMILADFTNKRLNNQFKEDVVIVHNSFEMLPVDEVLRTVSSRVEKSHLYLLSSELVEEDGRTKYNTINDSELEEISRALDEDEDLDHYYFEQPTNINGILKNILKSIEYYQEKYDTTRIPKVVVALDHTLLVDQEKGDSVLDTITKIAKVAIYLKKKGYMVILLGQLNNEIERPERIKNPDLHFPIKSDIYAQGQLYNACDNVLIVHQPELLGIVRYGKNQLDTRGLVHLQLVKQRFGKVGSIWLENHFERGQLIEFTPKSYLPSK